MLEIPPHPLAAGHLKLELTIGVLISLVATLIFGGISEDVINGDPLTLVDARFAVRFHAHAVAPLTLAI